MRGDPGYNETRHIRIIRSGENPPKVRIVGDSPERYSTAQLGSGVEWIDAAGLGQGGIGDVGGGVGGGGSERRAEMDNR